MGILSFVPGARELELGGILAAVLAAGTVMLVQHERLETARTALATEQAAHQRDLALEAAAAASASEAARTEEQRRTAAITETSNEAIRLASRARDDVVIAADAAGRLRQRAAAVASGGGCAAGNPASSAGSAPAADPGPMLADVLGRLGAVSGQLADAADSARIAGAACVASYESLTPHAAP